MFLENGELLHCVLNILFCGVSSATGRLIPAKEHGAIQLNVGTVEEGRYTGKYHTFAISGYVRQKGESDACLNRLFHERDLISFSK